MTRLIKALSVAALLALAGAAAAQAPDRVPFRQEEIDQMLAPVALYPDSLLSEMLMASTYPEQVAEAARWSRANTGYSGEQAVAAVAGMHWEASVKALTAYPQVLQWMDENPEWTQRLGTAFLAQPDDVMDAVQQFRRRAEAAGNLQSNDHMRVQHDAGAIVIEPAAPHVVYVPYYDPFLVYGPWWWPAYPPVHWGPPAYYVVPRYRSAFLWSGGVAFSSGFAFSRFDWPRRHVRVLHGHHAPHRPHPHHAQRVWRHDPAHRRGARPHGGRPAPLASQPQTLMAPPAVSAQQGSIAQPAVRSGARIESAPREATRGERRHVQPEARRHVQPETRPQLQPRTQGAQPAPRAPRASGRESESGGQRAHAERPRARSPAASGGRSAPPQAGLMAPAIRAATPSRAPGAESNRSHRGGARAPGSGQPRGDRGGHRRGS